MADRWQRRRSCFAGANLRWTILLLVGPMVLVHSLSQQEPAFRQLKITFVTGNAMKAREMNQILADHGATKGGPTPESSLVDLQVLKVDLPELQEVDTMAIAKDKALLAAQLANGPCLVEDTSLQFHALGGMPGPYIKVIFSRRRVSSCTGADVLCPMHLNQSTLTLSLAS